MMKSVNFLEELLDFRRESEHCFTISINNTKESIFQQEGEPPARTTKAVSIYRNVPDYFVIDFYRNGSGFKQKTIATYKGSLICIEDYEDLEHFLKTKLSPKRISRLRTYKRRLENTFNIRYVTYFGGIEDNQYSVLMQALKRMMEVRFMEKGATHLDLAKWPHYEKIGKELILKKQACLFVIYDGDKPISISFNPVMDAFLYGYFRGFDTDYSKFYLGFTDLLQQLEWCFANEIRFFDLLRGDFEYKSRFVDKSYFFRTHVVFPSHHLTSQLNAYLSVATLFVTYELYYPITARIKGYFGYLIRLLFGKRAPKKTETTFHSIEMTVEDFNSMEQGNLHRISLQNPELKFLVRAAYSFLYSHTETVESLTVFQLKGAHKTFVFKGQKAVQKVIFT
nr:GNAT family N-acetyltransferase [Allomuricauda sp.]